MTEAVLSQFWVQKLGWTLLHFLWQGTVIALAYAVVRRLVGRSLSAQGRYALACVALAAMAIAPFATFLTIPRGSEGLPAIPWNISASAWQRLLPGFVAVWLAGVVAFSIRLFGGWRFTAQLRSASLAAPAEWQRTLEQIALKVKTSAPVRLLISPLVDVPTVIGWLRPVILVPIGALTGLPADQITALLAHELAHIRRHDYLANILQSVAEALLFYHPAVWWVSGQIRAERELCCDDLAVAVCGDVLTYAMALAQLEAIQPPRLQAVLAANGGSLVNRVRRLMDPAQLTESLPGAGAAWAMMLLLVAGAGAVTVHATQRPETAARVADAGAIAVTIPAGVEARAVTAPERVAESREASSATTPEVHGNLVSRAWATLLYDPFLTPQAAQAQVRVPGPVAAVEAPVSTHGSIPAPVLMARTELPPPYPSPVATLHAETRVVQVEVSVRDSHGRPVTGLSRQDFTLGDEGKSRGMDIFSGENSQSEISSPTTPPSNTEATEEPLPALFTNRNATPPPAGHSSIILVDHTNGGIDGLRWSQQEAPELLKKGRRDERIALYAISRPAGLVLVQDYTTDRELLLKSMHEYLPGYLTAMPGDVPRDSPEKLMLAIPSGQFGDISQRPAPEEIYGASVRNTINSLARADEQPYEDTVEDVRLSMRALAEHLALVPGRKSVFWASGGFRPRATAGQRWKESPAWQKTISALNEADVAVNVIDTTDAPGPDADQNRTVMKQIADETGGRVWSSRRNEALAEGIEDSRATYTLGFYLAEGDRDDRFHSLQVKVNHRADLQLSYRQGYYAGATDMPDPATEGRAKEALEGVLLNQVDSRGVGITASVDVEPVEPGKARRANLRINLDPATLSLLAKNEGWTGKVDEMFVELSAQGRTLGKVSDTKKFEFAEANRADYEQKGVAWPLSIPIASETAKLAIIVRDTQSGRVGSLTVPLK